MTSTPVRTACRARKLVWIGVLPPHQGGSAVSGFQMLVGLARLGHAIRSLAPIAADAERAGEIFDARHPELGVTRFPMPYSETAPNMPAAEKYRQLEEQQVETGLSWLIGRERPDVIVLGRETFAWRAPTVAQRHGIPCILRIAGAFLAGVVDGAYPEALVARWLEQARKVDAVIAQTPPSPRTSPRSGSTASGSSRTRSISSASLRRRGTSDCGMSFVSTTIESWSCTSPT